MHIDWGSVCLPYKPTAHVPTSVVSFDTVLHYRSVPQFLRFQGQNNIE